MPLSSVDTMVGSVSCCGCKAFDILGKAVETARRTASEILQCTHPPLCQGLTYHSETGLITVTLDCIRDFPHRTDTYAGLVLLRDSGIYAFKHGHDLKELKDQSLSSFYGTAHSTTNIDWSMVSLLMPVL
jgi:hypothetical protein